LSSDTIRYDHVREDSRLRRRGRSTSDVRNEVGGVTAACDGEQQVEGALGCRRDAVLEEKKKKLSASQTWDETMDDSATNASGDRLISFPEAGTSTIPTRSLLFHATHII
jgi:hypothetical protein